MATKAKELENLAIGIGCLGKALDDEPLFILRAQDATAPDLVRRWARQVEMQTPGGAGNDKTREAYALADKMEEWQQANGRRKMPD